MPVGFAAKKTAVKTSRKGPKGKSAEVIRFSPSWVKGYGDFYRQRKADKKSGNGAVSLALYLKNWVEGARVKRGWLPSSRQIADKLNQAAVSQPIRATLVRRALDIAGTLTGRIFPVARKGYEVGDFNPEKLSPQQLLNAGVILAISDMRTGTIIKSDNLIELFSTSPFRIKNALSVAVAMGYLKPCGNGYKVLENNAISNKPLFEIVRATKQKIARAKTKPA